MEEGVEKRMEMEMQIPGGGWRMDEDRIGSGRGVVRAEVRDYGVSPSRFCQVK